MSDGGPSHASRNVTCWPATHIESYDHGLKSRPVIGSNRGGGVNDVMNDSYAHKLLVLSPSTTTTTAMSLLSKPSQSTLFPGLYGLVFDLIGTLTDDHTPVVETLQNHAARYPSLAKYDRDFWEQFAYKWDRAQSTILKKIAKACAERSVPV